MSFDEGFKFENFEEFYGNIDQVKNIIDNCKLCGAKLIYTHLADYKNLYLQEHGKCPECGTSNKKMIHIIN